MVCRGLDLDLSGKVAKINDSDTKKRSPRPHSLGPPHPSPIHVAIAAYEICHPAQLTLLPLHTHINVAIVTRSHFGN